MNPSNRHRSSWADYLGAVLASAGGGILFAVLWAVGWLGTKLSVTVVIGGGVIVGAAAGVIWARRKTSVDDFKLKRPT